MAATAAVLLALAGVGYFLKQDGRSARVDGRVGKPVLDRVDLTAAKKILIDAGPQKVTLKSGPEGWLVAEQGDFPADDLKLRKFLISLANETIEHRVTENPARLSELGLLTQEENGNKFDEEKTGTLVSLVNQEDQTFYQVLVGKSRIPGGGVTAAFGGQYIRFPEEKAAYLVAETLQVDSESRLWLDDTVLKFDQNKLLKSLRVTRGKGGRFALSREKPEGPWKLQGAASKPVNAMEMEDLTSQISDIKLHQVARQGRSAAELGREKVAEVKIELFDRRTYRMTIGEKQADQDFRYVTFSADIDPSVADEALKQEVEAFNNRFRNRIVSIYDWEAQRILKSREALLRKEDE